MMDAETKREEADREFVDKREELRRADEEKTKKNKARREKQKARKNKAKVKGDDEGGIAGSKSAQHLNGGQAAGQNGERNGVNGNNNGKGVTKGSTLVTDRGLPGYKGADQKNNEGGEVKAVEDVGIVIHDDG